MSRATSNHLVLAITGAKTVPGGIAKANLNVMHALSSLTIETGCKLSILSLLETPDARPDFLPSTVTFEAFNRNKKAFTLALLKLISRNVLFCFDHVSLALPLLPFAASGATRTVIFNHGSESWKRIQPLNRLSIRAASRCLTNSNYTLRKMQEHLGSFKGTACPLGLPPDFPLTRELTSRNGSVMKLDALDGKSYSIGNRMLLLVARMLISEREKGHAQLLEVVPDLLRRYPDLQVVFAGDGDDRARLADIAREKGIAQSVFLPGFLPIEDLRRLYKYCFAFVMPSTQEGFGLSYLEAMSYGKPCIGCFDQGTEDVVVDRETGYLIHDKEDRAELIRAISDLLDDPIRARELGVNGFNRLHAHFTAEQHQARVKKEIAELLTGK